MGYPQPKDFLTEEQYLDVERKAVEKSEYYQGECFLMAGASRQHNIIALNTASILRNFLLDKHCQPYMADMRILIDMHKHYVYPDVVVVCNENAYIAEDMANDATVIIEVLSPSTELYDRGMKFAHYQSLPSLKEYVLISQDEIMVELYKYMSNEEWIYKAFRQPNDRLFLPSINFSCFLSDLYASINEFI